jgi:hypothetical protein
VSSYPVCVCVCWLGTVVCLWLLHNLPAGVWLCRPAWCQLPDFSLPEHVPLPGISSRQKITHAHTQTHTHKAVTILCTPSLPPHTSNPHSASLCSSRMVGGGLVYLKKISTDLSQISCSIVVPNCLFRIRILPSGWIQFISKCF